MKTAITRIPELDARRAALQTSSSGVAKLLDHIFIGELGRCPWTRDITDPEILRSEVDSGGYDLIVECNGVTRHIQLKARYEGSKTDEVTLNLQLARRPCGCIVWLEYDLATLQIRHYYLFGEGPNEPLRLADEKVALHSKANSRGTKLSRPHHRIIKKAAFQRYDDIASLADKLFG